MLSRKQIVALWLCLLNEATQIELPFVIAVFMVRRWLGSEATHEDLVGRMTGILVSKKLCSVADHVRQACCHCCIGLLMS